mmetsp:Transcript_18761/g.31987  ORF Transcript_18761/g.31987 Transcript_18761/m.31987 type:complete len:93 (-) Transcript_18761:287-565(-)
MAVCDLWAVTYPAVGKPCQTQPGHMRPGASQSILGVQGTIYGSCQGSSAERRDWKMSGPIDQSSGCTGSSNSMAPPSGCKGSPATEGLSWWW